ncbi:MAG: hypothetical protein AUJ28_03220 [Parcubacteria group bacterium CG1_02_37_51]|uniref:Uncharacterized protein n=2 Tax=Candidatus Komeiliibacteriota TaxID=1817908 RepID=A0A2M8DRV1_9BACT|nr:MAG: hypothetical protein AUJ28_03220 [Parcubacteria group bacterium CG1_02_37_51]PIY95418.1 MAG: hypothetical protein COY67_00075 [Candidatus Komeilibacteria bacterium CG_4_10_14_0_8_um_filter_37_78]PJC02101.1 MAG: hypothetical protein CO073_01225 [Candidatus Komeilibacteria bacterium CG_4_9_14_0_8_um_filter_36_9]
MNNFTNKDLEETAQSQGIKLGYLISTLEVSDEIKDSFLAILPKMSLEQIDSLILLLEQNYLQDQTKQVDQDFENELKKLSAEYNQETKKIKDDVAAQIDDVIKQI